VGPEGSGAGLFKAETGRAGVAAGTDGTLGNAAIESTVVASSMAGVGAATGTELNALRKASAV
jgi:hypothetical protein